MSERQIALQYPWLIAEIRQIRSLITKLEARLRHERIECKKPEGEWLPLQEKLTAMYEELCTLKAKRAKHYGAQYKSPSLFIATAGCRNCTTVPSCEICNDETMTPCCHCEQALFACIECGTTQFQQAKEVAFKDTIN